MASGPLGITYTIPPGVEPLGVYEAAGGIDVFEASGPYLLEDGKTLATPLPVFDAGGPVFQDSDGNARSSLAVTGLTQIAGITWDSNQTWDNSTYWS